MTELKAKPFLISGPGTYRTRGRQRAIIIRVSDEGEWPVYGHIKRNGRSWRLDGTWRTGNLPANDDLVARIDTSKRTPPVTRARKMEWGVVRSCESRRQAQRVMDNLDSLGVRNLSVRRLPVRRK